MKLLLSYGTIGNYEFVTNLCICNQAWIVYYLKIYDKIIIMLNKANMHNYLRQLRTVRDLAAPSDTSELCQ